MKRNKFSQGFGFTVALFFVYGNSCIAYRIQSTNDSSADVLGFGGNSDSLEQTLPLEFLEQCPDDDPEIEEKFAEAFYDFKTCVKWTAHTLSLDVDPPALRISLQIQKVVKRLCKVFDGAQPCLQDFLTTMEKCLPDYSVNDVISGYQEGVSIVCADDRKRITAAFKELLDEDEGCRYRIMEKRKECSDAKPMLGSKKHILAICSYYSCAKEALNTCGGPKKNFHELFDDFRAAINRHVPCSSPRAFCSSPMLAAATLLFALFADRFIRHESLL